MHALPFTPCLIGCTASGKSEVGIEVARRTKGTVVACDAFAVYREMPILSAAPTAPSDVAHRLVGIIGPDEVYDAARFVVDADHHIARDRAAGLLPWIVGGTALYLRCFLKGFGAEAPRDDALRERLRELATAEGPHALHRQLAVVDPERAAALHPNDLRRVVRALEIHAQTGVPASRQRLEWSGPDRVAARCVFLERSRPDLDRRIALRTDAMFEAGVVDEVRALLARETSPQARQALGFAEIAALLEGDLDENAAREGIVRRTRRFARKQETFFRSFPERLVVAVEANDSTTAVADRVLDAIGGP